MSYDDMTAAADKWLHADGSVTTLAGEVILPADAARADEYLRREPIAAKWLLPDGSISGALPLGGGGQSQDISGLLDDLAPKSYVDEKISGLATASYVDERTTDMATQAYVDEKAAPLASKTYVDGALSNKQDALTAGSGVSIVGGAISANVPKRAFVIADITTGDKTLTVGDCQMRPHKSGDYCQVLVKSLSSETLYWSATTHYDGGGTQNRYGSGAAEQTLEDDIGYGGNANRTEANIQIGSQGWRLAVCETGTGAASANTRIWASLELMEDTQ